MISQQWLTLNVNSVQANAQHVNEGASQWRIRGEQIRLCPHPVWLQTLAPHLHRKNKREILRKIKLPPFSIMSESTTGASSLREENKRFGKFA